MTLSTIQPGPCGNISNECFSGPSGLGVLADLMLPALVGAPGPNMAASDRDNAVWGCG